MYVCALQPHKYMCIQADPLGDSHARKANDGRLPDAPDSLLTILAGHLVLFPSPACTFLRGRYGNTADYRVVLLTPTLHANWNTLDREQLMRLISRGT